MGPKLTFSSNGRSRIRFGENRLKTGGFPQKPRKLVGDCTITSDRGTDRLRSHPDKYGGERHPLLSSCPSMPFDVLSGDFPPSEGPFSDLVRNSW